MEKKIMEKQIKTNDYETGRRLNTSDSKDESISEARDDEKKATQTNLLIISKIFDTIKPKKLSKKCFYAYLYGINFIGVDLSKYRQIIDKIIDGLKPSDDYMKLVTMTSDSFKEYIESPVLNDETKFFKVIRKVLDPSEIQEVYENYDEFTNVLFTRAQMSKAESSFYTLASQGEGDTSQIAQTLAEYGISKKYFNGNYFEADDKVINTILAYYFATKPKLTKQLKLTEKLKLTTKNDCVDIICKYIFSIKADIAETSKTKTDNNNKANNPKNDDTVLVIDCIRDIINDILQVCDISIENESNRRIKDFTNKIAEKMELEKNALFHIPQNQINNYYKNAAKEFQRNSTSDITVPPLPKGRTNEKKINHTTSKVISANLFFIRETYRLLASLEDKYPNLMNDFYRYLGINEDDYEVMIKGGAIDCRNILEKLEPYKYPASLFRGGSATGLSIYKTLKTPYDSYRKGRTSIDELRSLLKLHLFYKIEPENLGLIIPTYALIEDLKKMEEEVINVLMP